MTSIDRTQKTHHSIDKRIASFLKRKLLDDLEHYPDQQLQKRTRIALLKLSYGQYGICESCNAEISIDRLIAKPSARRCIYCQQIQENLALYDFRLV